MKYYPVLGDAYVLNTLTCSARKNKADEKVFKMFCGMIGEKLERMAREGCPIVRTGCGEFFPSHGDCSKWYSQDGKGICWKTEELVNSIVQSRNRYLVEIEWL